MFNAGVANGAPMAEAPVMINVSDPNILLQTVRLKEERLHNEAHMLIHRVKLCHIFPALCLEGKWCRAVQLAKSALTAIRVLYRDDEVGMESLEQLKGRLVVLDKIEVQLCEVKRSLLKHTPLPLCLGD